MRPDATWSVEVSFADLAWQDTSAWSSIGHFAEPSTAWDALVWEVPRAPADALFRVSLQYPRKPPLRLNFSGHELGAWRKVSKRAWAWNVVYACGRDGALAPLPPPSGFKTPRDEPRNVARLGWPEAWSTHHAADWMLHLLGRPTPIVPPGSIDPPFEMIQKEAALRRRLSPLLTYTACEAVRLVTDRIGLDGFEIERHLDTVQDYVAGRRSRAALTEVLRRFETRNDIAQRGPWRATHFAVYSAVEPFDATLVPINLEGFLGLTARDVADVVRRCVPFSFVVRTLLGLPIGSAEVDARVQDLAAART